MEIEENKNERKISILLEDLASLESYAKDLFSFLPLPVCFVSSVGIILEANPAFEKFSGYKIDEIIGKPIEDIFDKKEIEELSKETLEKDLIVSKEINFLTKEKEKILVRTFAQRRKGEEEEVIGYFLSFLDLTEFKGAEKELKNSQTALLNILEDTEGERERAEEEKNKTLAIITNLADGLLVFDRENKLSLINPQAESFFDIKGRDIIGRTISELGTFPTLELFVGAIGKEIKTIFRKEISLKKDLILEISSVPMIFEEEKTGNLIVLHDITREKTIERMKTEFVSLSAHQLRTPLSAIKWSLRMLLEGDAGPITPEQKDFIEKTFRANERMINLVNDLLDITRIEEGRYLFRLEPAQFEKVVQSVIDSTRDLIARKKIYLIFEKPPEPLPMVKIDEEKIGLAIQTLLENALIYTPQGGRVTVSLKKRENRVEFWVRDTGIGIPKDQQSRVFSKFFRGANAIRTETEGTGLGLFITKNIIDAHNGEIGFESEEGTGTTFYFFLPI